MSDLMDELQATLRSSVLEKAGRFAELTQQKRELEQQINAIQKERDELEKELLDELLQAGVSRLSVHGTTLYIYTQKWARPVEGNHVRAVHALEENGLAEYIILGTQRASTLFRGDEEEVEGLPPDVRAAFEVYENVSLRARQG